MAQKKKSRFQLNVEVSEELRCAIKAISALSGVAQQDLAMAALKWYLGGRDPKLLAMQQRASDAARRIYGKSLPFDPPAEGE